MCGSADLPADLDSLCCWCSGETGASRRSLCVFKQRAKVPKSQLYTPLLCIRLFRGGSLDYLVLVQVTREY